MRNVWLIVLAVLFAVGGGWLFIRFWREEHRARIAAERVASTTPYARLLPMLQRHAEDCVETVELRADQVSVRTLYPVGGESRFTFSMHHMDELSADTLIAMTDAVPGIIQCLRSSDHYRLVTHEETGIGRWYAYEIVPHWKKECIRRQSDTQSNEHLTYL